MIDAGALMLYVFKKGRISVPMLMLEQSLSYPEARKALSDLEARGAVQKAEGMAYALDADLAVQGEAILRLNDRNLRDLLQANKEQYKAMSSAYTRGRADLGEFTRIELRRLQNSINNDVWAWLIAHGVVNESYQLVMDKKILGPILALLKSFRYGDEA